MILHILHYDQATGRQFASYVIKQFSAPGLVSEFVVFSATNNCIDLPINEKIRVINPDNFEDFSHFIDSLGNFSAIVLHGIFYPWCEDIIRSVPEDVKVAWMFWGGEIYDRDNRFLAPLTRRISRVHSLIKEKGKSNKWLPAIELFQRIDYCLTGEIEEYEYAKSFLKSQRLQFIWYTYYSIEDTVGSLLTSQCEGKGVCIFNSAAIGNNVFDTIAMLAQPKYRSMLKGRNILMPLSYGSPWIRNALLKVCPLVFGTEFSPILNFIPRDEYNKLLLNCSTMILPHYRPAGQGNILTALWLGMRVYLSEKSLSFAFFKRLGISIYSLESDFKIYGCQPMPEEDVKHNRAILKQWYGKQHIEKACEDVVKVLK